MKKRIILIVVALVVVALLWLLLSRNESSLPITPPAPTTFTENMPPAQATPSPAVTDEDMQASPLKGPVDAIKERITDSPSPTSESAAKPDLKAQLHKIMSSANQPISFFGKVIDQDDNPISGVKVTFQIRYMKEVRPVGIGDTFDYPLVTTGADGRFALTDAKGSVLAVKSLEKEGYEASEQATRGTYWYWRDQDPYRSDPDNPKIFHMWKKTGAEKLVRNGIGHAIRYDGTPTSFNLLAGRMTSNGDLRVTLVRNPEQIQWGQKNYEWTVAIEVPDGGLIASTAEQMYLAPVEGYQNKITLHMSADDPQWTATKEVTIYLKLRGGKYYGRAKLEFMVGSDRPTTPFSITSFVNPSGSRNLEYDSKQDIIKVKDALPRTITP